MEYGFQIVNCTVARQTSVEVFSSNSAVTNNIPNLPPVFTRKASWVSSMGCSSSTCWGDFCGWVVSDKALSVWQAQSVQQIRTKENICNGIFRFVMFIGQFPPALFTIQSITIAAVFPPPSIKEFQNINLAPAKSAGAFLFQPLLQPSIQRGRAAQTGAGTGAQQG